MKRKVIFKEVNDGGKEDLWVYEGFNEGTE